MCPTNEMQYMVLVYINFLIVYRDLASDIDKESSGKKVAKPIKKTETVKATPKVEEKATPKVEEKATPKVEEKAAPKAEEKGHAKTNGRHG